MTTPLEVIRHNACIHQPILDRTTLEELGQVDVLWTYPQKHRVLGLICKSGLLGRQKAAFKLPQVATIGSEGVLVHGEPQPTDAKRVSQLETLVQREVWSESGEKLGQITDFLFDLKTGLITAYLFTTGDWIGAISDVYQLTPTQILSFNRKRVLVPAYAVDRFPLYREGLVQKLTDAGEMFWDEVTQEWRSLTRRAERVTEDARDRWQTLAEQAKERAQSLREAVKEKAQTLSSHLQDNSQDWLQEVTDRGRSWAEDWGHAEQSRTPAMEQPWEDDDIEDDELNTHGNRKPTTALTDPDWDVWLDEDDDHPPQPAVPHSEQRPPQASPPPKPSPPPSEEEDEPWI